MSTVPGQFAIPACAFSGLQGGGAINPLEPSGDSFPPCDVGWLNPGEHITYTLPIAVAGAYNLSARVAAPVGSTGTFHAEIAGQKVSAASLTVPITGGYHIWQMTGITSVTLPAGIVPFSITIDQGSFNLDAIYLTKQ